MTAVLSIHRSGPLMSVQDDGRYGFRARGVSTSGAMDRDAHVRSDFFLRNIPVEVDTINTLENIRDLIDFKLEDIAITGIINAMGSDYEIGT